jgi:hypothetical protein
MANKNIIGLQRVQYVNKGKIIKYILLYNQL